MEKQTTSKDKSMNMTSGPIPKQMITFAFPIFLGHFFQQLYNTVDSLIVGNFCTEEALAAVSSSGTMIFLFVGLIFGLFSGAGVVIAQYFGANDKKKVEDAIHTTVALGLAAGIILTIFGVRFSPEILRLISTPENVLPQSTLYFRIYFLGAIFNVLYNTANGIYQAVGDSKHPLMFLIISSVTNVFLDLLFVGVFKMGVAGAATATVISQCLSCVLSFRRLMTTDGIYRVSLKKIRIHKEHVGPILKVGIPSGIQNSVIGIANIFVQSNINSFGDLAMAGCGAYSKVEGFVFLPITSFAVALTTFIGQNIGANKIDRVKKASRFGIICSIGCAESFGVIFFIFSPVLISMFSQNPEVIAYGVKWARTTSPFFFLLAFSHAAAGIMRGAGKAVVPMIVMLSFWCVIRVLYINVITSFIINEIQVIFWAYPITWGLSTIAFGIYLLTGKWLKREVKHDEL